MGYSTTSKTYSLYDEVNNNFVIFKDLFFLETNKNDKSIERQIDHPKRFSHLKTYYEFDNEIPNLEGGIPILDRDQSLEFPFEEPTPPHEEKVPTISPELDDVIERIERLNFEENEAPLVNQP